MMGTVNWLAVVLAALAAFGVGGLWYGPLFGADKLRLAPGVAHARQRKSLTLGFTFILALVSAAMLGHMFARIGPATLTAKPWLYFMQTGGVALAFVIPGLWTSYLHQNQPRALALIDAGYWLAAYLAMGTVFLALA